MTFLVSFELSTDPGYVRKDEAVVIFCLIIFC